MVVHVRALLNATRKDKPLFILQVMEQQRTPPGDDLPVSGRARNGEIADRC